MKERQILFNAPMVQAILAGRKSQTRRIVKLPKALTGGDLSRAWPDKMLGVTPGLHVPMPDGTVQRLRNPWGWPEPSHLWVRETFCLENTSYYHGDHITPADGRTIQKHEDDGYWIIPHYRATEPEPHIVPYRCDADDDKTRWTPSIFMPRWASRITLEITGVRAERLQDISYEDALAEGIPDWAAFCATDEPNQYGETAEETVRRLRWPQRWYQSVWDEINGHGSWEINPWVWLIEFRKVGPVA